MTARNPAHPRAFAPGFALPLFLNKQNKFSATKYNFIKKVSSSDAETICTANLALSGGGSVEYDYRIFKEGSAVKVAITQIRR